MTKLLIIAAVIMSLLLSYMTKAKCSELPGQGLDKATTELYITCR